nr:reverse transcriptase domain-containing protein [Tanacetum cinerariifolium]
MANQRTMVELLRAPTEDYAEAIVVPPILAEHFKLKHSLINMMTLDQFFGLEKDNPHDHIRWFNKITSTIKYKDVPNSAIKLMLFLFSLARAARCWLENEPPRSILTWEDLVSKFINEFFPPSRTTNLQNEISNFQQCRPRFFEFCRRWRFLERRTQDVLTIIENKSKVCNSRNKAIVSQVKSSDANSSSSSEIAKLTHATNKLKNMMASLFQKNTASTSGSRPLPSNTIANSKGELKDITTQSGLVLDGRFVPMPPLFINPKEDERAEETLTEPKLAEISRDRFVLVGKFTFPTDFAMIDYERDPRVPLILGRPFLQTARALIDVYGEEMILRDNDERLTLNMRHDTSSYSNQPHKESINMEIDSIIEDSVDECNLVDPNNNLVDIIPKMFIDEHTLDYSSPPLYDDVDDDLVKLESDNDDVYDDPFDSKEDKIKESKLLIDELDPPRISYFLPSPECDSVIYEDFSEVDTLTLTDNEDKAFNPSILIHENLFKVTIRVTPDKNVRKISISNASLILEDFNPLLYELPFHKEVPSFETLHSFSFENEERVSTSGFSLLKEFILLFSWNYLIGALKLSKSLKFLKARWRFFLALIERTSVFWMFHVSISIPRSPDKNVKKKSISHASLILEDFNPPPLSLYELPFHKEVPGSETLLSFSSENVGKVFKPGILTSKGVHTFLLPKLSHRGPKAFKVIKIFESRWRFFLALMERTSVFWMFRDSISIPYEQINLGVGSS